MKKFRSIKSKLLMLIFSISLLPIAAITVIHYVHDKNTLRDRILTDLEVIAESKSLHIVSALEMYKARTADFSSDGFIRNSLKTILDAGSQTTAILGLNKHLSISKKPLDHRIKAIFIADKRGLIISSTHEKFIGTDISVHPVFTGGMIRKDKEVCVGQPLFSSELNENCIWISSPVVSRLANETIGVLINVYSLAVLNEITTKVAGMGETDEIYLVNREKVMITESRFVRDASLRQAVVTEPVRRIFGTAKGMRGVYKDYRNITVAGASRFIAEYDWALLAEMDAAEAFVPLKSLLIVSASFGGVVSAVIIGFGFLLSSIITRPIKDLTYASERLMQGNMEFRVKPDRNDEVGVLAHSFNSMAEQITETIAKLKRKKDEVRQEKEKYESLVRNIPDAIYSVLPDETGTAVFISGRWEEWTGYKPEEFVGKKDTWITTIHPEDREAAARAFTEAVKEEKDYAFEYRVVNKHTGMVYYLRDHGVPVRDERGIVVRYDGIAVDITAARKLETALRESREQLQSILDNTTSVIYIKDLNGCYQLMNQRYESLFNQTTEQVLGRTDYDIFPHNTAKIFRTNDMKVINAKKPMVFDEEIRQEGYVQSYLSVKFPLYDAKGIVNAVCGISTDITERRLLEKALFETNQNLSSIIQASPLAIVVRNTEGMIKLWNKVAEDMFGWKEQEVLGKLLPMVPEERRSEYDNLLNEEKKGRSWKGLELRLQRKDASLIDISVWSTPIRDASDNIAGVVCIYADITERKRVEEEMRRLSLMISQSINIIFTTDVDGNIEYVNPRFELVTGYSKAEIVGKNACILASEDTPSETYDELWKSILAGNTWRGVFKNKNREGKNFYVSALISPICNSKGGITGFLSIQEDITEKRLMEERAIRLTSFDTLTGLLNRSHFIEVLNDWVYSQYTGALLLIDIDGFRLINDTFGHKTGDALLNNVAGLFKKTLSLIDEQFYKINEDFNIMKSLLCRMGGDEFALFLPSRNVQDGVDAAQTIRKRIEEFRFPEGTHHVTVSIGIAAYPIHGVTINNLLARADAAVYHAKKKGRNAIHLYQPEDLVLEEMRSRITWKGRIIRALAEKRFVPWYQPILDLKDNKVHHYEALSRMHDEEGKIVLPGSFINIAEIFGFVREIDMANFENALEYLMKLKNLDRELFFSVNLSGKSIEAEGLLPHIRGRIEQMGLEAGRVIFEITETAVVQEFETAIRFIKDLKSLGCQFSLDDFGVGVSSFTYLKELDVDFIKIDGSFIKNVHESRNDRLFVKSMVDVARGMGIKTIAEFVENGEIVKTIRELGVDYAQGYFIGKPTPEILSNEAIASFERSGTSHYISEKEV